MTAAASVAAVLAAGIIVDEALVEVAIAAAPVREVSAAAIPAVVEPAETIEDMRAPFVGALAQRRL
jgi:hypothetical protein